MDGYTVVGQVDPSGWSARLYYGDDLVGETDGLRNEKALNNWARSTAAQHKTSLLPAETHTFTKTIVV